MGQKGSSFLKRLVCKTKVIYEAKPTERMNRSATIEKILKKQGFIHDEETLIFVDTEPTDERNRAINNECHKREYISHLEHVIVRNNGDAKR